MTCSLLLCQVPETGAGGGHHKDFYNVGSGVKDAAGTEDGGYSDGQKLDFFVMELA